MTTIKRPIVSLGAAALLALSLTACGGGAPTDASKADYCDAVQGVEGSEEFFKALEDEDWDEAADILKDATSEIEEVGTPEDISDEEREGFEIQLDAVDDLSGDDIKKAVEDEEDPFVEGLSDEDKEKVEAYNTYENETCSDTGGE